MSDDVVLADVLSEFASTMLTDFPIQAILDHLVLRIVDVLPITASGVTLISPGEAPRYVAASNESALRFEELQTELDEGPCLTAYRTGEAVAVPDLRHEVRFPSFVPRALDAGLGAVFTFPMHNGHQRLGALDLYRDSRAPSTRRRWQPRRPWPTSPPPICSTLKLEPTCRSPQIAPVRCRCTTASRCSPTAPCCSNAWITPCCAAVDPTCSSPSSSSTSTGSKRSTTSTATPPATSSW